MGGERKDRLTEHAELVERYLDVHEAADLLDISEEELWNLAHEHQIPTHNIAGAFLRFRKDDIEQLKIKWRIQRELFPGRSRYFSHKSTVKMAGMPEKISDFWYFNDYYVVCAALVIGLLYFIVSSQ